MARASPSRSRSPLGQRQKSERGYHCARGGFGGQKLNAVQIGLGTFGTIVENLVGGWKDYDWMIHWLLGSTSERRPEHFRGIAIEPVAELIKRLEKYTPQLPNVRLVQAAVGEDDSADVHVHVLTEAVHIKLLEMVPEDKWRSCHNDLGYLRNMSSVGAPHPIFSLARRNFWRNYGIDLSQCLESLPTEVWSYGSLSERLNFSGCELLMIDAEGHDTKILRSVIKHCVAQDERGINAWPDLIVFETAGHCDQVEGPNAEKAAIRQLESHGYVLILKNKNNSNLANTRALEESWHLWNWVNSMSCRLCERNRPWPMTWKGAKMYCADCYFEWPPPDDSKCGSYPNYPH